MGETILWQRLDAPGHEIATITSYADRWTLDGAAVFVESAKPCRIEYEIECDAQWQTRRCLIRGSIGPERVHMEIERSADGEWSTGGDRINALLGCDDIDFGFSPLTNLLPIRRLGLAVGEHADVSAAWIRFPELTLEVLEQKYTRVASNLYQYESAGGLFRCEIVVDEFGCVIEYPGLWRVEATVTHIGAG